MSAILGGIGAGIGAAQAINGLVKNARANRIDIPETDPQQTSLADELLTRSRSFETGAAFTNARDTLGRTNAAIADGIVQVAGGNAGTAAANLARLGESSGIGFNDVLSQGFQQQQFYTGLASQLINDIAQRRLETRLFEKAQTKAEASKSIQDGFGNLMGGLTSIIAPADIVPGNEDPLPDPFDPLARTEDNETIDAGSFANVAASVAEIINGIRQNTGLLDNR